MPFRKSQHCFGNGMNTQPSSKDDSVNSLKPASEGTLSVPQAETCTFTGKLTATCEIQLSQGWYPKCSKSVFKLATPDRETSIFSKGFSFSPLPFFLNSTSKNKYIYL